MHPTILVKRKADALQRILATTDALAQHLELDPALVEALQPQGIKDPRVMEMKRLEALAALLDQLAAMAGVTEPAAVTVETAAAPADSDPGEEPLPDPSPIGDELPPPVLEEAAVTVETAAPPADNELPPAVLQEGEADLPAEEAPAEVEYTPEELPADEPKAAKKSTRGKRAKK